MNYDFKGQLIAVVGKGRSGKNTIAEMVRGHRAHVAEVAFADKIKEIVQDVYDFTDEQVYGSLKEEPDKRYPRPCSACQGFGRLDGTEDACPTCGGEGVTYLTPREAMQLLGTEWGRRCYPDTWIRYGFKKASALLDGVRVRSKPADAVQGTSGRGSSIIERCDLVLVTDCRFVNEAAAVRAAGGRVWRVLRPGVGLTGEAALHPSEIEQDRPEMLEHIELEISNTGTLDDLEAAVVEALRG